MCTAEFPAGLHASSFNLGMFNDCHQPSPNFVASGKGLPVGRACLDQKESSFEKPRRAAAGLSEQERRGMVPARPSSAETGWLAADLQYVAVPEYAPRYVQNE